nr:MAG TPA: hypothetical protein [Caudoviricetes sp.]
MNKLARVILNSNQHSKIRSPPFYIALLSVTLKD